MLLRIPLPSNLKKTLEKTTYIHNLEIVLMNFEQLDYLFENYGYEAKELNDTYRVYVLNQGMYHGAEILLMNNIDASTILERYSKLGYHAKLQNFTSVEQAEDYLFNGFFNTQTTVNDINRRYDAFAYNQVKHYCDESLSYEYISMPYSIIRDNVDEVQDGNMDIVASIKKDLQKKGAHLIVIEAAAGFGKTCTAYEVYKSFIDNTYLKPIFTELSRNRDAKQFKYILWSEIDREKDTTAKQDLVIYNIKKGKIPLIIDGFDELLSKDIDSGDPSQLNEFEQVETMLSTIGDLLTDEAKVILTSRKTAIFAGTEFEEWVDSHCGNFDVVRYQLERPNVKEWLSQSRYEEIEKKKIPLNGISNPVLLTYLRNIDENTFKDLLLKPECITEKYFEYLLNREKVRQNIIIKWEDQMIIFENLARVFAELDITGETRSFVKDIIKDYNKSKLLYYKDLSATKQTLDELVDTLTNHALLDRCGNKDFITFINEFVFGYLLGKSILRENTSFLTKLNPFPDYLIELAVSSFKSSSCEDKTKLWQKLSIVKNRMPLDLAVSTDSLLLGKICDNYKCEGLSSYVFERIKFHSDNCLFTDVSFVDVSFLECEFDLDSFSNVTFTGCKFVDCNIRHYRLPDSKPNVYCYGCEDFSSGFIEKFEAKSKIIIEQNENENYEIQLLSKFFKVDGKTPKMRHISSIRKEYEAYEMEAAFATFDSLKKRGMLKVDGNNSYISKSGISYYQKNRIS